MCLCDVRADAALMLAMAAACHILHSKKAQHSKMNFKASA